MPELIAPKPWHRTTHGVLRHRILADTGVASFTDGRDDEDRYSDSA